MDYKNKLIKIAVLFIISILIVLLGAVCFVACSKTNQSGANDKSDTAPDSSESDFVVDTIEPATDGLVFSYRYATYGVSGLGSVQDSRVVIPAVYNGRPVTRIDENFIVNYSNIKSIVISANINYIHPNAINSKTSINELVVDVRNKTFHSDGNCVIETETKRLVLGCKNSVIPNDGSVTTIGEGAFAYCRPGDLSGSPLVLPNSLIKIEDRAFYDTRFGTYVAIPYGIESIGDYAFASSDLAYMLPFEDTSKIDRNAFVNYLIDDHYYTLITENVSHLGAHAFESCNLLGKVIIKSNIKEIPESLFADCGKLKSIHLPSSIERIGDAAFSGCKSLAEINLPNGLTSIEDKTFSNCKALTQIEIQDGIVSIGDEAFYSCGIESVSIPDSVTSIGDKSFESSKIRSLTLGRGLTSIPTRAFYGCLIEELNLPENIVSIGDEAFNSCYYLTSLVVPLSVQTLGNGAFGRSAIVSLSILSNKTEIGQSAFEFCQKLETVSLPEGIVELSYNMFRNCTGLKSIVLPNGLKAVGMFAFSECKNLVSITLPIGLENISGFAFYHCSNLTSINIPDTVTTIGAGAFDSCNQLDTVILPDSVTDIGIEAFSECGALKNVRLPKNLESIESMTFFRTKINEIAIPEGVKTIESQAFGECQNLKTISIPKTVASIGKSAFSSCDLLESITVAPENEFYHVSGNCLICTQTQTLIVGCKNSVIPDDGSVKTIASYAFSRCSGLKTLVIPEGVEHLEMFSITECKDLVSLSLPSTLQYIDIYAISNCIRLTELCNKSDQEIDIDAKSIFMEYSLRIYSEGESHLEFDDDGFVFLNEEDDKILVAYFGNDWRVFVPDGTTIIGGYAFYDCDLISLCIPSSVKKVSLMAKYYCNRLIETCNMSEASVPIGAGYSCQNLEESKISIEEDGFLIYEYDNTREIVGYIGSEKDLVIPNDVPRIGAYAFKNCDITSVVIPTSVNYIGLFAFGYCKELSGIYYQGTILSFVRNVDVVHFYNAYTGKRMTVYCTNGNIETDLYELRSQYS